ncbi:MAG TPA: hypothetical protein VLD84_09705 [Nitrososphaeraceae archaeon]|nr:hypothetical protein [Nitrososphaeraceae archaeon]
MIILLALIYYKNSVRLGTSEIEEEEMRKLTDELIEDRIFGREPSVIIDDKGKINEAKN